MRSGFVPLAALVLTIMHAGIAPADGTSDEVVRPRPRLNIWSSSLEKMSPSITTSALILTLPIQRASPNSKRPSTPNVNGLNEALLAVNPNFLNDANGDGAANPFRLDRSQNLTADQDHDYTPEQQAFDFGLMDAFPEFTGAAGPPPGTPPSAVDTAGLVMGYYDGNTVTALWNYAQNYAMSDNHYGTTFGPS